MPNFLQKKTSQQRFYDPILTIKNSLKIVASLINKDYRGTGKIEYSISIGDDLKVNSFDPNGYDN